MSDKDLKFGKDSMEALASLVSLHTDLMARDAHHSIIINIEIIMGIIAENMVNNTDDLKEFLRLGVSEDNIDSMVTTIVRMILHKNEHIKEFKDGECDHE